MWLITCTFFTEAWMTSSFYSHHAGNPNILRPGSFPPWCKGCCHPYLHGDGAGYCHPLSSNLCPHLLQSHHLHPHHLYSLSQQFAWHPTAASSRPKPPAQGRCRLPAAQLLRQRGGHMGQVVFVCRWTDCSCTAHPQSYIILMWFHADLTMSDLRAWAVQLHVREEEHCCLRRWVCD